VSDHPKRYLWTDAFAVCNYLELFRLTDDKSYKDLALRLVDQVHHTLGRHRDDDTRNGWISGLDDEKGERHPTKGGLRIGKKLNERKPDEPPSERLEWDQDGQYYHYLTKWMHALNQVSRVTGDPNYIKLAVELAKAAHTGFTYVPPSGGRKRMYWKMSIDLTYPIVPSMGQHDPLDGFITYSELQMSTKKSEQYSRSDLSAEIADMAKICQGKSWATNDPLGIGGLLSDALRIAQLMRDGFTYGNLLEVVMESALIGMGSFVGDNTLRLPAEYRLAFRELGISIGLKGVEKLMEWVKENPDLFKDPLQQQVEAIKKYVPIGETIERFWMDSKNRETRNWTEHREINMVMLATSLAPNGFLMI
ncbi:MAG: hypothetical protein K8E24_013850, partial [Methanobacterium paludis]|nr:hypothetical protein [Methanobacterium paludis]